MCLFISLLAFGPRVAVALFWLFQPIRFSIAFESILWPILGIVFLPWTTLMYVIVSPGGIVEWDWLWLALMFAADMGSYGGSAYKKSQ